jgi:hypothetical protein
MKTKSDEKSDSILEIKNRVRSAGRGELEIDYGTITQNKATLL